MAEDWTEIAVFLHGMTPDEKPVSPAKEYQEVRRLFVEALDAPDPFAGPSVVPIWNFQPGRLPHQPSFDVAKVSSIVNRGIESMDETSPQKDFNVWRWFLDKCGIWPRVKDLYYNGLGDVFYYVSKDGEEEVRQEILQQIVDVLKEKDQDAEGKFSLTIFAHSAGSLIAHDMLWHIFSPERKALPAKVTENALKYIRENYADQGRLRVRKLYTAGSPLAPLFVRSRSLIDKIKDNKRLDPATLGLTGRDDGIENKTLRWLNFWDRDDILGAPLADFYTGDGSIVRDYLFSVGWKLTKVHTSYWRKRKVLKTMADAWS